MANHKRRRPKNRRAGCLMCKPHKSNGLKDSQNMQTIQERKAPDVEDDWAPDTLPSAAGFSQLDEFLVQFKPALVSQSPWNEKVLEWFNGPRKITVYIDNETSLGNYIKVWGANTHTEMKEGVIYDLDGLRVLLRWLYPDNVV